MFESACRSRIPAGLVGGATAAAVMFGVGAAHAAPTDDGTDAAITAALAAGSSGGSGVDGSWLFGAPASDTEPISLLGNAATNFTDAGNVLTGLDFGSGTIGDRLDNVANILTDRLEPAQDVILAHSGSLAGPVEQLFIDPLNQQWFDTSQALLNASQALESATTAGSDPWGHLTALLEINNVVWSQMIPLALASVPVGIIGGLLGDTAGEATAGAALGLFDLPF